jgi:simple sugar transport system permease protein
MSDDRKGGSDGRTRWRRWATARVRHLISDIWHLSSALLIGVVLLSLVIWLAGVSPVAALRALVSGAVGSWDGVAESLVKAIPLILTGLAVALAFRCQIWNIGAEGQFLLGMLACVWVGTRAGGVPAGLLLPAALGAGAAAGALWAGVAAVLKLRREVPEVISTIMLNFIALRLVSFAVTGPLQEPERLAPQTALIDTAARLARVGEGTRLHLGIYVALVAVVVVAVLLFFTVTGFRIRAVGLNPIAAEAARIPVARTTAAAFLMSGALAGLAGAVELSGVNHRIYEGSTPGYGYTAIAVALLGRLHPGGVLLAGLFFGAMAAGAGEMQRSAGVSSVLVYVIQGITIFLVVTFPQLGRRVAPALTPIPSPNPGRGEPPGDQRLPLSQDWERGSGGEGGQTNT